MQVRLLRSVSTVAAAAAAALVAATLSGPAAFGEPGSPDPSRLAGVSGYLLDENGDRLSDGTLTLNVLEPDARGDDIRSRVLATDVTDPDGYFALTANVSTLARTQAGRVDLEMVYQSAPGEPGLVYDFPASPPGRAGSPWSIDVPGSAHASPKATALNGYDLYFMLGKGALSPMQMQDSTLVGDTFAAMSTELTTAIAEDDSLWVPDDEMEGEETEGTGVIEPSLREASKSSTSCESPYVMFWDPKNDYDYSYVPTKWFRTRDHASLRWTFKRSHETTFGIAMDADGRRYQGGMGGERFESSGLDFRPEVGNNAWKMWKVRQKHQKYRAYCYYAVPEQSTAYSYWLDVWKWAPRELTGGSVMRDTKGTVNCGDGADYTDRFGAPTTISRSSSATYNNSFSVIGIKLDSRTLDRDDQTFTVLPDTNRNPRLCGTNKAPLYANFVKEIN